MQYPTNARVIRAICSGRYSTKFAQTAFDMGAGAVLYSGCHLPADCHFLTGNHWMAKREPRIRGWMKRKGISDDRFRVEWVSASEGKKWQGIMTEMSDVANKHAEEIRSAPKKKTSPKPKTKAKPSPMKKAETTPRKSTKKTTTTKKTTSKKSKKKE